MIPGSNLASRDRALLAEANLYALGKGIPPFFSGHPGVKGVPGTKGRERACKSGD